MNILNNINSLLADAVYEKPINTEYQDFDIVMEMFKSKYYRAFQLLMKKNIGFFRGNSDIGLFVEREPKLRISANNISNLYTRLMSGILSSWIDFPHRNKSFICSMSKIVAKKFGVMYWILPENDANIGICPKQDIWHTFKSTLRNEFEFSKTIIDDIRDFANIMLEYISLLFSYDKSLQEQQKWRDYVANIFNMGSDDELFDLFKKADDYNKNIYKEYLKNYDLLFESYGADEIDDIFNKNRFIYLLEKFNSVQISMLQYFNKIFDPYKNEYIQVYLNEYPTDLNEESKTHEIWTDSKCLFINYKALHDLILGMDSEKLNYYKNKHGETFNLLFNYCSNSWKDY